MHKTSTVLALVFSAALAVPAFAAADHTSHDMSKMSGAAAASSAVKMSEAVVKKVDVASGKVTLQHGPLQNLDMPAMTMAFKLKDPSRINELKAGDKIRFIAENPGNVLTIGQFEKVI